jgi:acyl-CoA thioester hydrolase
MKRIKQRIERGWDVLEIQAAVNFSEVDSMRIVWHGHYLRYCESAREAYSAARGLSYQEMERVGSVAPVVRCQLEYLRPARAGQLLTVRVAHIPQSQPSLGLFYEVLAPDGALLCVCETVQVFVDASGTPFLTPPPPVEAFFAAIQGREQAQGPARPAGE